MYIFYFLTSKLLIDIIIIIIIIIKVSTVGEDSDCFKTVTYRNTRTTGAPAVITVEDRRQPLVGLRNSASLPINSKRERLKARFFTRFSPEVTADYVKKALKKQLSLQKLVCTRHKSKFNTYASFRVSGIEDEFPLITNTDVWLTGCLIAPFMVNSPLKRFTPQVHPSLETQFSPIVLVGSAEVAVMPPNNGFEPQRFRYFFIKMSGDLEQM
jgi:hypothetical protein